MKNFVACLTLALAALPARAAVDNPLPYLLDQAPAYLLALDCGTGTQLRLAQAKAWQDAGDQAFPDTFFMNDDAFAQVREHGNLVTQVGSAFAFLEAPSSPLAKTYLSDDGHIDAAALGAPATIGGCRTLPFALNVRDQGGKYAFMVDASIFSRLPRADQYASRMLMHGFRESLSRALLNWSQPNPDFVARRNDYLARGFHYMSYHSAELVLDDKIVLGANGPVSANALAADRLQNLSDNSTQYDQVFFDSRGALREIEVSSLAEAKVATKIFGGRPYADPKGQPCGDGRIVYRVDGSLAFCAAVYFTQGGGQQTVSEIFVGRAGMIYDGEYIEDSNGIPGAMFAFAEVSPDPKQVNPVVVKNLHNRLVSLTAIDNDPLCGAGLTFTNNVTGKTNVLTINVPRDCVALAKAVWKKL